MSEPIHDWTECGVTISVPLGQLDEFVEVASRHGFPVRLIEAGATTLPDPTGLSAPLERNVPRGTAEP